MSALMTRRGVLKAGGAVVLLVAGGAVWRAVDQGVFSAGRGPAYEPWAGWRDGGGPLALVRAAILAANPHNSQPWLFKITESRVDLFADLRRNLGTVDPDLREMHIGIGCALENLLLAARANGYDAQVTLFPDVADATHAARVDLSAGEPQDSALYAAIPHRHTNRGPYAADRAVAADVLADLATLGDDGAVRVFWFASDPGRGLVGTLIIDATEAIIADREQSQDSGKWLRFDWDDVQAKRDGLTVDAQGDSPVFRAVAKILPPLSLERIDQFWLAATRDTHVATAAAFGILAIRDRRDNAQRVAAGRLWQRVQLSGAARGLAMQPLNQVTERADREVSRGLAPVFGNRLRALLGDPDWHGVMPFRLGYPRRPALPSPRRPAEAVIV
jgi:hypothetical protein